MTTLNLSPLAVVSIVSAVTLVVYFVAFFFGRKSAPKHPVVQRLEQIEKDKEKKFDNSDYWASYHEKHAERQREYEQKQREREVELSWNVPESDPVSDTIRAVQEMRGESINDFKQTITNDDPIKIDWSKLVVPTLSTQFFPLSQPAFATRSGFATTA